MTNDEIELEAVRERLQKNVMAGKLTQDMQDIATLGKALDASRAECERLKKLNQTGLCAFCGIDLPGGAADVPAHVEICPDHPMAKLSADNERLREALKPVIRERHRLDDDLRTGYRDGALNDGVHVRVTKAEPEAAHAATGGDEG